jgi:GAF domain-containing protein
MKKLQKGTTMEDARYLELANFAKKLLESHSVESGLPLISNYLKKVIGAQRCSIFIVNRSKKELWTSYADGVEKIVISLEKGIVGETIKERKPLIVNDAYSDEHFCSAIDKETGFRTKSLATAPIFNSKREIIGVLELLNKENGFNNEDIRFMIFFAHYISGFLELIMSLEGKQDE